MQEYSDKTFVRKGKLTDLEKITERLLSTETFYKLEVDTGILRLHRGCKQLLSMFIRKL